MTREEIIAAVMAGKSLSGATLSCASLNGANLSCASLNGATLSGANLSGATLSYARLSYARLSCASLNGANLSCATLSGANLSCASLSGANLSCATLNGANLSGANLSGANLSCATLNGATLSGAKGIDVNSGWFAQTRIIPSDGDIIGWKKCVNNVVVKLRIPAEARRSHAFGRKCRAEFVDVLEVIGDKVGVGIFDGGVRYVTGQRITCHEWCEDFTQECAGGIHFFITRKEAEGY